MLHKCLANLSIVFSLHFLQVPFAFKGFDLPLPGRTNF